MERESSDSVSEGRGRAERLVWTGMLLLVAIGGAAAWLLRPRPAPPPPAIAADPLLVQGRELFLARCLSCHGESGRGDGPIASSLTGPPPGDLTDSDWKHGHRSEDVLAVISRGVPDSQMAGWASTYSPEQLRALTAYVFHLAGEPVPESLR